MYKKLVALFNIAPALTDKKPKFLCQVTLLSLLAGVIWFNSPHVPPGAVAVWPAIPLFDASNPLLVASVWKAFIPL